ncbi:hypothetical protein FRC17_000831 [Serendipita sp. 399]|nr:hypothetical protein FRC17_000831 [Serendipita sp. 399]
MALLSLGQRCVLPSGLGASTLLFYDQTSPNGTTVAVGQPIAAVIFTLRVIALYNRNQLVLRALYLLLFLCWTSSFGFTLHTLIRITPTIYYSPVYHACVTDTPLSLVAGVFLGPALFESTLFLLTLSRAILYTRQMRVLSNFQTPFLTTLYRDGFYYFLAVVAVHLWNVIAYWTQPVKGNYMGTHFAWTVMTVMSSRVYLNLVRAAYGGDEDEDEDEDENDEEREDTGGGRGLSTTTTTAGLRHPQRKRQWIRCSTATAVPMQEFGVSPERRGRGGRDPSSLEERGLHQHQRHQQLVTLPPPPPMATTTTIEADFKDADDDSTKQPP